MEAFGFALLFAVFAFFLSVWVSVAYVWIGRRSGFWATRRLRIFAVLSFAFFILMLIDSLLIEPYWLSVTEIEIKSNSLRKPLSILHLSDLHYDGRKGLLDDVVSVVERIRPDVVCITGDYLNSDGDADIKDIRDFLKDISRNCGAVLCVSGNWDNTLVMENLFTSLPDNIYYESFVYETDGVAFVMLPYGFARFVGDFAEKAYGSRYRVLLYHTPELADDGFVSNFFDLYLCGHTHGGQIRLPFWGALITLSETGKRYEAGLYRVGERMLLYVSRGVGMTPIAPPIRLFCRPEVTVIRLSPR